MRIPHERERDEKPEERLGDGWSELPDLAQPAKRACDLDVDEMRSVELPTGRIELALDPGCVRRLGQMIRQRRAVDDDQSASRNRRITADGGSERSGGGSRLNRSLISSGVRIAATFSTSVRR